MTSRSQAERLEHAVEQLLERGHRLDMAEDAAELDMAEIVETGVPYRIVLRTIEDEKVDLLVMNIHGKRLIDRALVGSTAERTLRAAAGTCPVLLIPPARKAHRKR